MSRRVTLVLMLIVLAVAAWFASRSQGPSDAPERMWGGFGVTDGRFTRPRAIAIDPRDRVYVVDFAARIQVFDSDGDYLGPTWTTPDFRNGRPSGLGIDRDGHLIVADSHYHCLRICDDEGNELRVIRGEFGYISDAVQDRDTGRFYISEFGDRDRISCLEADGTPVRSWGATGSEPGQMNRIRALCLGRDRLLYAADSCNHRIQVFTLEGEFVREFGTAGTAAGELSYPYDIAIAPGGEMYVAEYGNHRIQKFDAAGKSLGLWGGPGRKAGRLASPWGVAIDSRGGVFVVDTENHRIVKIRF